MKTFGAGLCLSIIEVPVPDLSIVSQATNILKNSRAIIDAVQVSINVSTEFLKLHETKRFNIQLT